MRCQRCHYEHTPNLRVGLVDLDGKLLASGEWEVSNPAARQYVEGQVELPPALAEAFGSPHLLLWIHHLGPKS